MSFTPVHVHDIPSTHMCVLLNMLITFGKSLLFLWLYLILLKYCRNFVTFLHNPFILNNKVTNGHYIFIFFISCICIFQIFEWWYFKKYGTSFIEQVSLNHISPLLGGTEGQQNDNNNSNTNTNSNNTTNAQQNQQTQQSMPG